MMLIMRRRERREFLVAVHQGVLVQFQSEIEDENEEEKELRGSKSEVSGRRMREVACPTCTVHLQVQVPTSGSETIECGVCQHPFLNFDRGRDILGGWCDSGSIFVADISN